ncbi:hypothetical protein [Myxococcus sp. Y35]|uniref:hypothetical protein n=1 Tax=Pseudomyxococcus flavus TaxID=3115648 RepID=UPI003CF2CA12
MRSRERELQGGIEVDGPQGSPNPQVLLPKYIDIRWEHTETLPAHLLVGFQVAVYEGDDPNDTDSYFLEPVRVGPAERRVVVSLRLSTSTEVKCAVQALYSNGTQSSWRVLGGAVVADPDTVKLATADLKNVPAAAAQEASRNAVGAFTEAFERSPFDLGNWLPNPSLPPPAASLVSGEGFSGGNVLRCTNAVWMYSTVKLPYDPTKLYRLRCRVRQLQEPTSGGKALYCGLVGWAADGVTMVNAGGLNDLGSQHYYCIGGALLPASTEYSEFTGWVKGLGDVAENWPSQDPRNPRPMHHATRYVSLVLIANLDAGNGVVDFDSAVVDVFDESATPRVYTALNPDGSISYNVGISDGSGAPRTIAKGRQAQLAAHGNYVAFSPPFQNTPMVLLRGGLTHEPRAKWGPTGSGTETGAYNPSLPTYDDTQAIMNGGSGFTLRARLRQRGGNVTARANNPASASNLATGIGSTVEVTLSNAPATNDQYALRFNATIYLRTQPRTGETGVGGGGWEAGTAQGRIVVALDSLDVGQSWVERATATLWANSINNTVNWVQASRTYTGEVLTAAAPGLGAADRLRLRIKSVSVPEGSNQPTVHVWHSSVDAGAGVTYSTSSDQYASKTPDEGDQLYWEALDA